MIHIPKEAFEQHIIVLGKTRSGKSSVMRLLVEHLLDQGKPVCIVDPKGDWWGLKASSSGKQAGYPVVIFGGEHADVPLNSRSGAPVAELLATGNRSAIIDLGGWMPGDRTQFWIDFASTYFRTHRGRRWLVIDEVHNFCFKGKVMSPDAGKMLHWSNRLASEGLGKGISMLAASQRPQKVHNDFLTSCETLIAMRVIHEADRSALKDWIDGCGDLNQGKVLVESIAQMKRGEAWAWSPEAEFGPKRIQFPLFKTYDSFKAQGTKEVKLRGWAEVNLDEVRKKLEAAVKEAEANDPNKLRQEIRALKNELVAAKKAQPSSSAVSGRARACPLPHADQRAVQAAVRQVETGYRKQLEAAVHANRKLLAEGGQLGRDLARMAQTAARIMGAKLPEIQAVKIELPKVQSGARMAQPPAPPAAARSIRAPRSTHEASGLPPEGVSPKQVAILRALAEFEAIGREAIPRTWVAARSGASHRSSAYTNNLGALRSAGLIDYGAGSTVRLSDAGRVSAPHVEAPLTTEEMLESCLRIVSQKQGAILKAVHEIHPESLSRQELAERAGASPTSSAYTNNLGALRSAAMIDYGPGSTVKCADWLFID